LERLLRRALLFDCGRGALSGVCTVASGLIKAGARPPGGVQGGSGARFDKAESGLLELCRLLFVGEMGVTGSGSRVEGPGSGVSGLSLFTGE
jgi:hypothetical protein